MMTQIKEETVLKIAPQRSPGYLMVPFGWVAKPLGATLEGDPSLYPALFTLSRRRMHLMALALAHWRGEIDASFARLIVSGTPAAVLDAVLGHRLKGLKRALGHLPVVVLPRKSYLQLVELLEDPAAAKLIYHLESLQEGYIGLLHSIPAVLRRVTAAAIERFGIQDGLGEGLRILAARGAAPSFDALVADLAAIRQPTQLVARLGRLVQQLPLPDLMPPAIVAEARRLDDVGEIGRLSKRFKNCLADCYLNAVNDGRTAIYYWPHALAPAVCAVNRHGRIGWALQDAKGPENADLPPARMEEIRCAFAAAGIPGEMAVEALEQAAGASPLRPHRIRRGWARRRNDAVELQEMFEEFEALEAAA
jgi:hypothetical protein